MRLPVQPLPAEAKPFDVVGFGENSLDLVAVLDGHPLPDSKVQVEHFQALAGGVVASSLVACARQAFRARYVGSLGNDHQAKVVEQTLVAEGLDVTACRRCVCPNRTAIILVDQRTGRRTVLEARDPALAWTPRDVDVEAMTSGRVLLVDARDPSASAAAARAARKAGIPVVVDVEQPREGLAHLLANVDVLISDAAFPAIHTGLEPIGRAVRALADEYRPALTVATLGADGALAWFEGREWHLPAWAVTVVDTTGAGDAFRGGFVAGWLRFGPDADVRDLLGYAGAVAALNCTVLGAMAGMPTRAQVDALVTGVGRGRSN